MKILQSVILTLLVFLEESRLLLSLAAVQAADDALAGDDLHLALGDGELLLVAELLDVDAMVSYFFASAPILSLKSASIWARPASNSICVIV